jgi:recombination protein RecT
MADNLRGRVAARANGNRAPGTAVAPAGDQAPATIIDHIRSMKDQFAVAMPKGAEAEQLVRDAITAVRTTKNLDRCDAQSVLGSLMTCAQLGLRPNVMGQAFLLPFWDAGFQTVDENGRPRKGGYRAQFVPGYKGLVQLAYRHPLVTTVIGRTVHEGEEFDVDLGLADTLVHKPCLDPDQVPGEDTHYYALWKGAGGHGFWVMTRAEARLYRDKYAPRNKDGKIVGPWATDDGFPGMAIKSCLRQLSKWMPASTELVAAVAADGQVRTDLSVDALPADPDVPGEDVVEGEVVGDTAQSPPDTGSGQDPAATQAQLTKLVKLLEDRGVRSDEGQHQFLSEQTGRPITSRKDLTRREASGLIDALEAVTRPGGEQA